MKKTLLFVLALLFVSACEESGGLDTLDPTTDPDVTGPVDNNDIVRPPGEEEEEDLVSPEDLGLEACAQDAFDIDLYALLPQDSTYFVRKGGSDDADGRSWESAFATISHAVDQLEAGDVLTIGPGEYHESVWSEGLGSDDVDTVIRAAINQTVILRGDIPAPVFEQVEGFDFIWGADFDGTREVQMVNELDTLTVLERTPAFHDLEFSPGFFHQDFENHRIYISTTDSRPATEHVYTLSVIHSHGIYLRDPVRVIVDGLVVTGFNTATEIDRRQNTSRTVWGAFVVNGRRTVIRNVHAYMNGRGIGLNSSADDSYENVIERSVARANDSRAGEAQSDLAGLTLFPPSEM